MSKVISRMFTKAQWDDKITARLAHIATMYSNWSTM
jgi:hypothetical protein